MTIYTFTGGRNRMSMLTSEKFYYIMDYSSHYYRVDSKDQLVAAVSENEATIFSFADANRRIGVGTKSRFYYMTPVNTEDAEISDEEQETREVIETEISKAVAENSDVYDLSKIDWEEYLTNISKIAVTIPCECCNLWGTPQVTPQATPKPYMMCKLI